MNHFTKTAAGLTAVLVLLSGSAAILPETDAGISILADAAENVYGDLTYAIEGVRTKNIVIKKCDAAAAEVEIPAEIDGVAVTRIEHSAFSQCENLSKVTIPESVTEIGSYAFSSCPSLTSIVIPSGVTLLSNGMFKDCTGLADVTLSSGMTQIDTAAFNGCTALTSLHIPAQLTDISLSALYGCTAFAEFTVDVDNPVYASENGVLLSKDGTVLLCYPQAKPDTSYTMPDTITTITPNAFNQNQVLAEVAFSANLTLIQQEAFKGCTGLTSLSFPEGLETIESAAFSGCSALTSVTFPGTLTLLKSSAFSECTSLTAATLPEGLEEIEGHAFEGCSGLEEISLPDSLTALGVGVFDATPLVAGQTDIMYVDGWVVDTKDNLLTAEIPEGTRGLCSDVFKGQTLLTSIVIPDSVSILPYNCFAGCTKLSDVTLPDSLTFIDSYAFSGCTSLAGIQLPKQLREIEFKAFADCTSLTELTIPESVTSVGWKVFANTPLISDQTGLIYLDGWLLGCDSSIEVLEIAEGTVGVAGRALESCKMTSLSIPDSVRYISYGAFSKCTNLTEAVIPDSVVSLGQTVFADCTSLTTVTLPNTFPSIGLQAFRSCTALTDVYYGGTEAEWDALHIDTNGNEALSAAAIHFTGTAAAGMKGDVNEDGEVNILDVIKLNKNLLSGETLTAQGAANADVDGDSTPSAADALTILKYTIKLLETL